jgi:hypothetical protein
LAIQARTARSGHQLFSSFRLCSKQDLNPVLVQEEKFVGADFDLTLQQGVTSTMDKVVVDDWQATQAADRVWSRGVELHGSMRPLHLRVPWLNIQPSGRTFGVFWILK